MLKLNNRYISGLKEEQIERILDVFTLFDSIHKVILFGSRAKSNYKPGSDIDLAIEGKEFTHDELLLLHSKLYELDLPYKFDLVIYTKISDKEVIEHINRAGITFYESSN